MHVDEVVDDFDVYLLVHDIVLEELEETDDDEVVDDHDEFELNDMMVDHIYDDDEVLVELDLMVMRE